MRIKPHTFGHGPCSSSLVGLMDLWMNVLSTFRFIILEAVLYLFYSLFHNVVEIEMMK